MQNLNQAIKRPFVKVKSFNIRLKLQATRLKCLLLINILLFISSPVAQGQTPSPPPIPQQFQSAPINSKALEKIIKFTVDQPATTHDQNLILDKTGVFLIIATVSPLSKDTKIKVFDSEGREYETFIFTDGNTFA